MAMAAALVRTRGTFAGLVDLRGVTLGLGYVRNCEISDRGFLGVDKLDDTESELSLVDKRELEEMLDEVDGLCTGNLLSSVAT